MTPADNNARWDFDVRGAKAVFYYLNSPATSLNSDANVEGINAFNPTGG